MEERQTTWRGMRKAVGQAIGRQEGGSVDKSLIVVYR